LIRPSCNLAKRGLRIFTTPRRAFFFSVVIALIIGVPAAYAVGWTTYADEVELAPHTSRATPNPVYSSKQRMYQNQTQLDSGDPDLRLDYLYPTSLVILSYFVSNI
jgi:hypothetical protein